MFMLRLWVLPFFNRPEKLLLRKHAAARVVDVADTADAEDGLHSQIDVFW